MAGFNPVYAGLGDNKRDVYGATEVAIFTIAFAAGDTYLTGGLALTNAIFGLSRPLLAVEVMGGNTASIGMTWSWNTQTNKLQAEWTGPAISGVLAEVANNTSLTGVILTVIATTLR